MGTSLEEDVTHSVFWLKFLRLLLIIGHKGQIKDWLSFLTFSEGLKDLGRHTHTHTKLTTTVQVWYSDWMWQIPSREREESSECGRSLYMLSFERLGDEEVLIQGREDSSRQRMQDFYHFLPYASEIIFHPML